MSDRMARAYAKWLAGPAKEGRPYPTADAFRAGWDAALKPHAAVAHAVPVVLFFATKADADEFAALARAELPGLKEAHIDG